MEIELKDVQEAHAKLRPYLKPSPLLFNPWLSDTMDCNVYLKLENMQPIGSFKIRGATYKISCLSENERKKGVIAASAGNHAQGVAWGSKQLGVNATIVMPVGAPLVKVLNTQNLGAEVILKGETYDESFAHAMELSQQTGRIFIHAFEDRSIIAGQGTIGLELLDSLPQVDYIIGSVGGGGMMAGIGTVFKALSPNTQLIGCQALEAASMIESIRKGHAIKLKSARTFADGISIAQASEKMRKILSQQIDEWIAIDDDSIAAAVLTLLEKAKILAEGSGAVPLAALSHLKEQAKKKLRGKSVVLIVSGGNLDVNVLARIIDMGLVRAGRRVRVNVWIPDRPGSLAKLTGIIAQQGANILQTIHDRNDASTRMNQTEVELTLETRGPDHSAQLIKAMKESVLRLEFSH